MKFLMTALILSATGASADSLDLSIDGQWTVTDRICASSEGTAPTNDRFVLGRDSLTMSVNGRRARVTTVIEGETFSSVVRVDQTRQLIKSKDEKIHYYVLTPDRMIVVTTNFGKGGTCDAELITTFDRKTGN